MRAMAILGLVAISCAGCALTSSESNESDEGAGGDEATGEDQEAASDQDTPVTLPYSKEIKIEHQPGLLGHPFHVAAGALVSIAIDARWSKGCHWPYHVALRDAGILGAKLKDYTYPSDTIHTEHWKVPSAGMYRLEITLPPYLGCLPFTGQATITSP